MEEHAGNLYTGDFRAYTDGEATVVLDAAIEPVYMIFANGYAEVRGVVAGATEGALQPGTLGPGDVSYTKQTTQSGGTGRHANCYAMSFASQPLTFDSCYQVRYAGYSEKYYYYEISQDISARPGSGWELYTTTMRVERHYGTVWAGPNSRDPDENSKVKGCDPRTLSVSAGPFTSTLHSEQCEEWFSDWSSGAEWYEHDWFYIFGVPERRSSDYLLMQRRYRDKNWKFTFTAAALVS